MLNCVSIISKWNTSGGGGITSCLGLETNFRRNRPGMSISSTEKGFDKPICQWGEWIPMGDGEKKNNKLFINQKKEGCPQGTDEDWINAIYWNFKTLTPISPGAKIVDLPFVSGKGRIDGNFSGISALLTAGEAGGFWCPLFCWLSLPWIVPDCPQQRGKKPKKQLKDLCWSPRKKVGKENKTKQNKSFLPKQARTNSTKGIM